MCRVEVFGVAIRLWEEKILGEMTRLRGYFLEEVEI